MDPIRPGFYQAMDEFASVKEKIKEARGKKRFEAAADLFTEWLETHKQYKHVLRLSHQEEVVLWIGHTETLLQCPSLGRFPFDPPLDELGRHAHNLGVVEWGNLCFHVGSLYLRYSSHHDLSKAIHYLELALRSHLRAVHNIPLLERLCQILLDAYSLADDSGKAKSLVNMVNEQVSSNLKVDPGQIRDVNDWCQKEGFDHCLPDQQLMRPRSDSKTVINNYFSRDTVTKTSPMELALKKGESTRFLTMLRFTRLTSSPIETSASASELLLLAADTLNVDCMQPLLDAGADTYHKDTKKKRTALHRCLYSSRPKDREGIQMAETLLKKELGLRDKKDDQGKTALFIASVEGYIDMMETLLKYGADPGISDINNKAPLHELCHRGNVPAIKALLENCNSASLIIDQPGPKGETPLIIATKVACTKSGWVKVVEELVKHNANPLAKDDGGNNAFKFAGGLHKEYIKNLFQKAPAIVANRSSIVLSSISQSKVLSSGQSQLRTSGQSQLETSGQSQLGTRQQSQPGTSGQSQLETSGQSPLDTTGRSQLGTSGQSQPGTTERSLLRTTGRSLLDTTGRSPLDTTGRSQLGTSGQSQPGTGISLKPLSLSSARSTSIRSNRSLRDRLSRSVVSTEASVSTVPSTRNSYVSTTSTTETAPSPVPSARSSVVITDTNPSTVFPTEAPDNRQTQKIPETIDEKDEDGKSLSEVDPSRPPSRNDPHPMTRPRDTARPRDTTQPRDITRPGDGFDPVERSTLDEDNQAHKATSSSEEDVDGLDFQSLRIDDSTAPAIPRGAIREHPVEGGQSFGGYSGPSNLYYGGSIGHNPGLGAGGSQGSFYGHPPNNPGDDDEPPPSQAMQDQTRTGRGLKFACPYAKGYPSIHPLCLSKAFARRREIKPHLMKYHSKPYCHICYRAFNNVHDVTHHIGQGRCFPRSESRLRSMTIHQKTLIDRVHTGNDDEKWFQMFNILLPNCPEPPDPYALVDEPKTVDELYRFLNGMNRLYVSTFSEVKEDGIIPAYEILNAVTVAYGQLGIDLYPFTSNPITPPGEIQSSGNMSALDYEPQGLPSGPCPIASGSSIESSDSGGVTSGPGTSASQETFTPPLPNMTEGQWMDFSLCYQQNFQSDSNPGLP